MGQRSAGIVEGLRKEVRRREVSADESAKKSIPLNRRHHKAVQDLPFKHLWAVII